jgi:hypothetical protein
VADELAYAEDVLRGRVLRGRREFGFGAGRGSGQGAGLFGEGYVGDGVEEGGGCGASGGLAGAGAAEVGEAGDVVRHLDEFSPARAAGEGQERVRARSRFFAQNDNLKNKCKGRANGGAFPFAALEGQDDGEKEQRQPQKRLQVSPLRITKTRA